MIIYDHISLSIIMYYHILSYIIIYYYIFLYILLAYIVSLFSIYIIINYYYCHSHSELKQFWLTSMWVSSFQWRNEVIMIHPGYPFIHIMPISYMVHCLPWNSHDISIIPFNHIQSTINHHEKSSNFCCSNQNSYWWTPNINNTHGTCTSFDSSVPNSFKTFLGSRTARPRYSRDLYLDHGVEFQPCSYCDMDKPW